MLTHRLLDSSISALIPLLNSCSSLAIPFLSRSTILQSLLDIFLLCRALKPSWSTRIHQLQFHLCHSSTSSSRLQRMPLYHLFDPRDSADVVVLSCIHCVRFLNFMIRDSKQPSLSSSSLSTFCWLLVLFLRLACFLLCGCQPCVMFPTRWSLYLPLSMIMSPRSCSTVYCSSNDRSIVLLSCASDFSLSYSSGFLSLHFDSPSS